jgi:hypothetical protein
MRPVSNWLELAGPDRSQLRTAVANATLTEGSARLPQ